MNQDSIHCGTSFERHCDCPLLGNEGDSVLSTLLITIDNDSQYYHLVRLLYFVLFSILSYIYM